MAPSPSRILLFVVAAWFILSASGAGLQLGVNYGMVADDLPPPAQVATLLQSTIITKVKLFSVDADVLHAFANTGLEIMLGIGNDQIKPLATQQVATQWVQANVVPFMPATKISSLSVGNEILSSSDGEMIYELQFAMANLHSALQAANLTTVLVTTPHSLGLLQSSVPPSNGSFSPGAANILRPILSFLARTSSPFLANAYPFFGYLGNPNSTNLQYALFNSSIRYYDRVTRLYYDNMFVAQIDAVYSAIAALGFTNVTVAVGECGWPSLGDKYEPGVGLLNAKTFNTNLVKHLTSGQGTPLRPNTTIETYIFALFNENLKPGATSERNWGLFKPDMSPVYDCGVMKNGTRNQSTSPSVGSIAADKQWCMAKSGVSDGPLQAILNWACQQAGMNCSPIQPAQSCYNPNTLLSHASYAMNSYFQMQGRHSWNCYFNGYGVVVSKDPSKSYLCCPLLCVHLQNLRLKLSSPRTADPSIARMPA